MSIYKHPRIGTFYQQIRTDARYSAYYITECLKNVPYFEAFEILKQWTPQYKKW